MIRMNRALPLGAVAVGDDVGYLATGATHLGVEAHGSAARALLCLAATAVQWRCMRRPARTTVSHLGERATSARP